MWYVPGRWAIHGHRDPDNSTQSNEHQTTNGKAGPDKYRTKLHLRVHATQSLTPVPCLTLPSRTKTEHEH